MLLCIFDTENNLAKTCQCVLLDRSDPNQIFCEGSFRDSGIKVHSYSTATQLLYQCINHIYHNSTQSTAPQVQQCSSWCTRNVNSSIANYHTGAVEYERPFIVLSNLSVDTQEKTLLPKCLVSVSYKH